MCDARDTPICADAIEHEAELAGASPLRCHRNGLVLWQEGRGRQ